MDYFNARNTRWYWTKKGNKEPKEIKISEEPTEESIKIKISEELALKNK